MPPYQPTTLRNNDNNNNNDDDAPVLKCKIGTKALFSSPECVNVIQPPAIKKTKFDAAFFRTKLRSPADGKMLTLPCSSRNMRVDDHIREEYPNLVKASVAMLQKGVRKLSSSISSGRGNARILNVLQGEMAYATGDQVDVMVSDDATTCHMIAVRSYVCGAVEQSRVLCSMAHLDAPGYASDLRDMFLEHVRYHHRKHVNVRDNKIQMDLHIVGGFDDESDCSIQISENIIRTLADLCGEKEFRNILQTNLRTCAVSRINDTGFQAPVGRGIAIEPVSGRLYLATIEDYDVQAHGPALALRSCRIFGDRYEQLSVVHTAYKSGIEVQPFRFDEFENIDALMLLPDEMLLQLVSTSPDVEKPNFCHNYRRNLRFLRENSWEDVFGVECKSPAVYR